MNLFYYFQLTLMKLRTLTVLLIAVLMMMSTTHAQLQRTTNLWDVTLRFCNDTTAVAGTKAAVLEVEPEQELDICLYINNDGPTNTTIWLNFVDGTITADADQKKACEPENTKTNFGQYITNYPTTIEIEVGETVQVFAKAKFPAGYAGTAYGCATFQVIDDADVDYEGGEQTQMFTIVSRRANFVDINVMGEYIVDLQATDATTAWSFPLLNSNQVSVVDSPLTPWQNVMEAVGQGNPFALRIGKNLSTRSVLVNQGNVWLDVTVNSRYRAWWGLIDIDQWSQVQKLVPKQTKTVEFALDPIARWVGGPVTVTHQITYQSIIIGSGGIIDPAMLAPQSMTLVSSWLVTAWHGWQIIGWVLLLILWYITYRIARARRKHKSHKK